MLLHNKVVHAVTHQYYCSYTPVRNMYAYKPGAIQHIILVLITVAGAAKYNRTAVWARQQETPNLGKPEILIGAPSSNDHEHRLSYRI